MKRVLLLGSLLTLTQPLFAQDFGLKILDDEVLVLDGTDTTCPKLDKDFWVPDGPPRAYLDDQNKVRLIVPHFLTYPLVGDTLETVKLDCSTPVLTSAHNTDATKHSDFAWPWSPYRVGLGNYVALIHNEWHGAERKDPALCPSGDMGKCWYNTVTMATSKNGRTFSLVKPAPGHVVAKSPFALVKESMSHGFYEPTNLIKHPKDNHYYFLARTVDHADQRIGFCVFRSLNPTTPEGWAVWNGSSYAGDSSQGVKCAPVAAAPTGESAGATGSVHWSTFYEKFVLLTFSDIQWRTGFYMRLSDDLVNWSAPKRIAAVSLPWGFSPTKYRAWVHQYPSFLDPRGAPNFDVLGKNAYLYFVTQMTGVLDRQVRRVSVEFTKDSSGDGTLWRGPGCYQNAGKLYFSNGLGTYCRFTASEMRKVCDPGITNLDQIITHENHGRAQLQAAFSGRCVNSQTSSPMLVAGERDPLPQGCYRTEDGAGHYSNGQGRSCTFLGDQLKAICGSSDYFALAERDNHGANVMDPPCQGNTESNRAVTSGCYSIGPAGFFSNGDGVSCPFLGEQMMAICKTNDFNSLRKRANHGTNRMDPQCAGPSAPTAATARNDRQLASALPRAGCYMYGRTAFFSNGEGASCPVTRIEQVGRICRVSVLAQIPRRANHGTNRMDPPCR